MYGTQPCILHNQLRSVHCHSRGGRGATTLKTTPILPTPTTLLTLPASATRTRNKTLAPPKKKTPAEACRDPVPGQMMVHRGSMRGKRAPGPRKAGWETRGSAMLLLYGRSSAVRAGKGDPWAAMAEPAHQKDKPWTDTAVLCQPLRPQRPFNPHASFLALGCPVQAGSQMSCPMPLPSHPPSPLGNFHPAPGAPGHWPSSVGYTDRAPRLPCHGAGWLCVRGGGGLRAPGALAIQGLQGGSDSTRGNGSTGAEAKGMAVPLSDR